MGKVWMGRTALGLAIATAAGCAGLGPTQKTAGELTIKQGETAKVRAQSVIVNGPVSLANLNGKIQSDAIASVISAGGGNVISAGGANVISAGGGNVISAGGGNLKAALPAFRVQAAITSYTPVTNAFVYLEDVLTGNAIGKGYKTDENGQIKLTAVPDTGAAVAAIARFKIGEKEYRMGVNLGMGKFDAPIYADPINTVVEGRIRQILRDSGKASALSFQQLKEVWAVFNDADVSIDVTALENGKTLEDLFNFYNSMVGTLKALDDKDPAHTDKSKDGPRVQVVKTYMKTLQAK
jgi:hypothetical protein